jgi:hypothetical protein
MIQRITATCNKECKYYQKKNKEYHWDRTTIGNIIENIPKLIKKDGFWENVKILYL